MTVFPADFYKPYRMIEDYEVKNKHLKVFLIRKIVIPTLAAIFLVFFSSIVLVIFNNIPAASRIFLFG